MERLEDRTLLSGTELITNGSFESGSFSGWNPQLIALPGGSVNPLVPWTVEHAGQSVYFNAATPQDGSYDAANGFDGGGPMQYVLAQTVSIPFNSSAVLSWKDRIQWDVGIGFQPRTLQVQVRNAAGSTVLATPHALSFGPVNNTSDTGWQAHSVDLSGFAGSTVQLDFVENIPQSFTGPGQFEIDAISLHDHVLPVVTAGFTATAGQLFSGSVATFTDPDSPAPASAYSATVTWGDETQTNLVTISANGSGGYTVTAPHNYSLVGPYVISVAVTKNGVGTATGQGTTTVAPLPTARDLLAAATGGDGRVYAIGGAGNSGPSSEVDLYNPVTNAWAQVTPLPNAHYDLAAAVGGNGRVYAISGFVNNGTYSNEVDAYNPVTNSWTQVASLPTAPSRWRRRRAATGASTPLAAAELRALPTRWTRTTR